jgi:hypothetical protein
MHAQSSLLDALCLAKITLVIGFMFESHVPILHQTCYYGTCSFLKKLYIANMVLVEILTRHCIPSLTLSLTKELVPFLLQNQLTF